MADPIDVAHYQAELMLQHLAVAKWAFGIRRDAHTVHAEEHLTKCADALGFDLVKRKSPAEAHDAALAARRAEDGPEQIEDMEWSR